MVKNGRYGPYVSHNGVNATLTGDKTPETVTLDEAIVLLDARAAMMGNSPKGRRAAGRKTAKAAGTSEAKSDNRAKKAAAKPKKSAAAGAPAKPKRTRAPKATAE